jgi:hypothetical protein BACCOPRO_02221
MKHLYILLISLTLGFSNAYSQKLVMARVVDYITNTDIAADSLLKVNLLAKDSSFISDGWTSLEGEKPKYKTIAEAVVEREGSYIIRVSHPDYYTLYAPVQIKFYRRESEIFLGKFALKRKLREKTAELGEALVTATKLKFYFNNDTLVYNADAFITQQGFVLQNILQKMPGLTISNDGEILSNGRKVETLLLNGKDFFNNDRKTLLENLPAFMVKHVKVYEKEKDKTSLFERERELKGLVMDIRLKPDYHSTFLSSIEAAAGTDKRYYGRVLGLKINDFHRLSVFAGANNTNHNEELTRNGKFYNMDNGVGQKDFYNAGVLYNVDERDGRYSLEGKTRIQWSKEDVDLKQVIQQFYDQYHIFQLGTSSSRSRNFSFQTEHSLSLFSTTPWSFTIKPSFSKVTLKDHSENSGASFDRNVSNLLGKSWSDSIRLFSLGETLNTYGISHANVLSFTPTTITNAKLEIEKSIDIPHTDDKLTINASAYRAYTTRENYFQRHVDYIRNTQKQTQHQYRNEEVGQWKWSAFANYLLRWDDYHSFIGKLSYDHDNLNSSDQIYQLHHLPGWTQQSDVEKLPNNDLLQQAKDLGNSKSYQEWGNNLVGELGYMFQKGKYDLNVNIPLRYVHRKLNFLQKNNDQAVYRALFSPDINVRFATWLRGQTGYNYSFSYNLKHEMPAMQFLIPQTNDINPLFVIQGNPELGNIIQHKINGRVYWAPVMRHNHTINLNYTYTDGLTSSMSLYNERTGVTTSKFRSVNGNQQLQASLEDAVYLTPRYTHKLTNKISFNYTKSVEYNGLSLQEADRPSTVHNYYFIEEVNYSFAIPSTKIRGEFAPYVHYHRSASIRDSFKPLHATTFGSHVSVYAELPWSMRLQTDLRTISRRGYNDESMNDNEFIWNANLTKAFSNKFSISLEAFDLLGQRKNVVRFVNAQSNTESIYNNLRQYIMLHLTLSLNKH